MSDVKFRYLYHPETKHFLKAIGIDSIQVIPANSTILCPYRMNVPWYPKKMRFNDPEITELPNVNSHEDGFSPDLTGDNGRVFFVNNYWTGEDWEIRNTPYAWNIAQENTIVKDLMENQGFFLVQKVEPIETGRTYYILMDKDEGYETLVSSEDKEWSKELYQNAALSAISFIEFEEEQNEFSIPPDGNVYYFEFDENGKYVGAIKAELHYTEKRWPNPKPDRATEVAPPFDKKPPYNSVYFWWNGTEWKMKNAANALGKAKENKIVWDLVGQGYVLVNMKKSYFKGYRIGEWYILYTQEKDEYTIVHTLDKEFLGDQHSTYQQSEHEIAVIEGKQSQGSSEEPITEEEIQESIARWNRYEEKQREGLDQALTPLQEVAEKAKEDWENKIQEEQERARYYVEGMKSLTDKNFEEDKFYYLIKANFMRFMEKVAKEKANV